MNRGTKLGENLKLRKISEHVGMNEPELNLDGTVKKKAGRPAKLNSELIEKAYDLIASGRSERSTYTELNICEVTWNKWKARGRKANRGVYFDFVQSVTRANNKSIGRLEDLLNACAFGRGPNRADVNVAKWLLKHRAPDEYSDRASFKIEQDQPLGQLPVIPVKFLNDEESTEDGDS